MLNRIIRYLSNCMKVVELREALDGLDVEYPAKALKPELERLLKNAERRAARAEASAGSAEESDAPVLPVYNQLQVVEVLGSRHLKTHLHCRMENGQTMHVPKHLFN